jgi:Ca2+-binding RTX toxin-like protein
VRGAGGADYLLGNAGSDLLVGGVGGDYLNGGRQATDPGTDGDDVVAGGPGDDVLDAGAGADRMSGASGRDWIRGGMGDDILVGGPGVDDLEGGFNPFDNDPDDIEELTDNDYINGGSEPDRVEGQQGSDRLVGGSGTDALHYFGTPGIAAIPDVDISFDNQPNDGPPGEGDNVAGDFERVIAQPAIDLRFNTDDATGPALRELTSLPFFSEGEEWRVVGLDPDDVSATITLLAPAVDPDAAEILSTTLTDGEFALAAHAGVDAEAIVNLRGGNPHHEVDINACERQGSPGEARSHEVAAHPALHAVSRRVRVLASYYRRPTAARASQLGGRLLRVSGAWAAVEPAGDATWSMEDSPEGTLVAVGSGRVAVESCVDGRRLSMSAGERRFVRSGDR